MATPQPPPAAEVKKKPKVEGGQQRFHRCTFTPKKTAFTAPTQGLEHIIFDNMGTVKAAFTFNLNIKAISKHLVNRLKYDGPLAALAVCELKEPTIEFPDDPSDTAILIETTKWQHKYNHAYDQQKWWAENTQKIYNLLMQHSTQEIKTKLLGMSFWASTSTSQDSIALLKITSDMICHKKDGSTDVTTIIDLVKMGKDMYLIHQAPNKLLSSHLSKFKGVVNVVKSSKGSPWSHPAATKIVFQDLFSTSNHGQAKSINSSEYQVATAEANRRYLAALFFHGLSNKSHRKLKKNVHNNALTGLDTVPYTCDKVLQLAHQYKSLYQLRPAGGGGGGVTFAQKGKAGGSTPASTPSVASAKKSLERKPHPVPRERRRQKNESQCAGKKVLFQLRSCRPLGWQLPQSHCCPMQRTCRDGPHLHQQRHP
jgi:hypothetical protein